MGDKLGRYIDERIAALRQEEKMRYRKITYVEHTYVEGSSPPVDLEDPFVEFLNENVAPDETVIEIIRLSVDDDTVNEPMIHIVMLEKVRP